MTITQSSFSRGEYRIDTPQAVSATSTTDVQAVQNIVFGQTTAHTINPLPIAIYWSTQRGDGSVLLPSVGPGGYPVANPIPGSLYFVVPNIGAINAGIGTTQLWLYTAQPTQFSNGWIQIYAVSNSSTVAQGGGGDGGAGGGGD